MTPTDPHVSGWMPDFRPADEQLDRQAARLRSLPGRGIGEVWTAWDLEHDEWFTALPVVLRLADGAAPSLATAAGCDAGTVVGHLVSGRDRESH